MLTSDPVNSLSWAAECFFYRLMLKADDFGRFDAREPILRASLYPLKISDVREADITRWMVECQKAGLIVLYESEGKRFLEIPKFDQRMRAKVSKWPTHDRHVSDIRPSSAHGGGGENRKAEAKGDPPDGADLPKELDTPAFQKTWDDWQAHRKEKKKPITPTSRKEQLESLAEMGEARAIAALRHSIRNGWTGIFEPKENNGTHQRNNPQSSNRNAGTANEGRSSQYAGVGRD